MTGYCAHAASAPSETPVPKHQRADHPGLRVCIPTSTKHQTHAPHFTRCATRTPPVALQLLHPHTPRSTQTCLGKCVACPIRHGRACCPWCALPPCCPRAYSSTHSSTQLMGYPHFLRCCRRSMGSCSARAAAPRGASSPIAPHPAMSWGPTGCP